MHLRRLARLPVPPLPVPRRPAAGLLVLAALLAAATDAAAGWSTRRGGELGTLVTTSTPAGDELFLFCSRSGLGVGIVARLSPRPGGPSDLTRVPVTVAIEDRPPVALAVEGFEGAWVAFDREAAALAPAIASGRSIVLTIAPSHAEAFEAGRQVFVPGGGFATALDKARFPARCRPK
ncbi:hypothetical protein PQJ75_14630 [Rhodoplanes sp. TEM]|uniref:Uncharacterized protein n=1 Tax=Rhodoplanes tepidamans TaxID=200616 RepID=A0ABT5JDF0_RHOTP|nr:MULTISPECIES: hypothetical protein [Rhodoplanes]MDC7787538.1 hypothetical protein [Rhodoplanes tepidamans]MDC7984969.1 hypothetical protein [Rhodoplanes sp. TEM]MDQ0357967.1 hypothetical protein [Rhodoplanes tepidamans]